MHSQVNGDGDPLLDTLVRAGGLRKTRYTYYAGLAVKLSIAQQSGGRVVENVQESCQISLRCGGRRP